jgi:protein-glutamine gamma-glutamyltransferase
MNPGRGAFRRALPRLDMIIVALLAVIVTVPFGRLFYGYGFLGVVAVGAAVPVVVTCLFERRPWSWTFAGSVIGISAAMALLVFHAGFSPSGWRHAWNGFAAGWTDLLTVTAPAVASPTLIAVPVFLAWVASLAGVELARRTRLSGWPAVPPLVLFVVALAFAGTRPARGFFLPTVVVLTVLGLLLARAHNVVSGPAEMIGDAPMAARARSAMSGPGMVALVGLVAVLIGPLLVSGDSRRFDIREKYRRPISLSTAVTPFAEVDAAINGPDQAPAFTARFTGVPSGVKIDRIPIALLEQYDGSVWGTDAEFTQAGPDLPPGPATATKSTAIHQTYKITPNYPTAFLPALERPQKLSGTGLGFDRQSGMIVSAAGGPTTLTYSVVSDDPTYTAAEVQAAASRGNEPSASVLVVAPPEGWTTAVETFASRYGTGNGRMAQLNSLVDELRSTQFGYSTLAPPGQSLGVLDRFLSPVTANPETAGNRLGSPVQFAGAFAVLARALNVPSRIVVGYKVDPAAVQAGRTITVRPKDMYAWVEVNLAGLGWVPFDPTNTNSRNPTQTPPPPKGGQVNAPNQATNTQPPPPPPVIRPKHHHINLLKLLEAGLVLGLVLPGGVIMTKRAVREFRFRYGNPARRILGAWLDARDQLRAHHVDVGRSMTVKQVADGLEEHDAALATQVAAFAPIIDAALYAPEDPADDAVDAAWHLADTVGAALKAGSSPPERLLAAVDPRPLLQLAGRHND